ncbi:DUF927 domain-containing protein, partial [Methylobacterium sp. J-030]|uniref:DUF927 domain-containing protein n=1 Tax=Methylobacterium sp. J-030 TaxID=2836627 RepID=UPI001FBA0357
QEATAAIVTDTLLCLDEIGVAEGRDAAAAVYQLASGVGKGRSARDGSMRAPMTWRVLTLSTGELPMAAKIAEDKQRKAYAGQAVRLLDVPADAGRGFGLFDHAGPEGDPARLAEALQKAALSAYGEAGPAFVRALMDMGQEEARTLVVDLVDSFVLDHAQPCGSPPNLPVGVGRRVLQTDATHEGDDEGPGFFLAHVHQSADEGRSGIAVSRQGGLLQGFGKPGRIPLRPSVVEQAEAAAGISGDIEQTHRLTRIGLALL